MRRPGWGQDDGNGHGRRRFAVALLGVAAVALVLIGCGDSSSSGAGDASGGNVPGAAPSAMQVLTKVERGDIAETVTGAAKVTVAKGQTTVTATVPKENAAAVATGQKASVVLFPAGAAGSGQGGQGNAPLPQDAPSGAPMPQASGAPAPQPGQSGAPSSPDGSGAQGYGGRGGFGFGGDREPGTEGTVSKVSLDVDGSATVTIRLATAPSNATDGATGVAAIEARVLATDVIVIPTAAISGSGDAASVQVLASGQTSSRSVEVGAQSGGRSEIVSGLEVGENVVWTRSFPAGGQRLGASPFPGQGQPNGTGAQP